MPPRLVLLTGFEPFLDVAVNPSGELARALRDVPPAGIEVYGGVLPVSVERVPAAYDALLDQLGPRSPDLLLATGVHRGPSFRLERRARARLRSEQADNDGRPAAGTTVGDGVDRATELDLDALERALAEAGAAETAVSDDAGGYVCERTYHHVLTRAEELGVPGLFLHVPPLDAVPLERQVEVVRAFLPALP